MVSENVLLNRFFASLFKASSPSAIQLLAVLRRFGDQKIQEFRRGCVERPGVSPMRGIKRSESLRSAEYCAAVKNRGCISATSSGIDNSSLGASTAAGGLCGAGAGGMVCCAGGVVCCASTAGTAGAAASAFTKPLRSFLEILVTAIIFHWKRGIYKPTNRILIDQASKAANVRRQCAGPYRYPCGAAAR